MRTERNRYSTEMKLLKSVLASLVLGTATSPALISPAMASDIKTQDIILASSQCNNMTGNYSYLGQKGYTRVFHNGNNLTIYVRNINGDEHLIRANKSGDKLYGDIAQVRKRGVIIPISQLAFRKYIGQINSSCSFTSQRSRITHYPLKNNLKE